MALADAKIEAAGVQDELAAKDAEIARLSDVLKFRAKKTTRINGFLYELENGQPAVYPFCPKRFRLIRTTNIYQAQCPNCAMEYAAEAVWSRKPDEVLENERQRAQRDKRGLSGFV
jgi:hypothetical protein